MTRGRGAVRKREQTAHVAPRPVSGRPVVGVEMSERRTLSSDRDVRVAAVRTAMSESAHPPDGGGRPAPDAALFPPARATLATPARRRLPGILGGLLGGGAFGFVLAFVADKGMGALPPTNVAVALAALLLAFWPQLVLHEAGHALAGLARGMRAVAFGIGPFRVERSSTGRWHWRRGGGIRGIAGFAALVPQRGRGFGRGDQLLFAAGGPLANFLSAGLCLGLVLLVPERPGLTGVLYGTAACGILMGAANLVPFHVQGWRSDGRGILDLLRGHPDAALQLQVNQLMALSLAGVRPRDWPADLLPAVVEDGRSPLLGLIARLLRLSHAIDRRDDAAARIEATAIAPRLYEAPEAFRPGIGIGLASYAALMVGDVRLVAAWRAHCEGGIMDFSPYRDWLDAEIAALQGDRTRALARARAARDGRAKIHDAASLATFEDCLDRLDARLTADADTTADFDTTAPRAHVKGA